MVSPDFGDHAGSADGCCEPGQPDRRELHRHHHDYADGRHRGSGDGVPQRGKPTDDLGKPWIAQFRFPGEQRRHCVAGDIVLDGLLKKHDSSIAKIIEIEVPMLELINRLDERSKTDRCMPYDTSTAKIVKRLGEHEKKTVPVIEKYNQLHGVVKIDGMGSFDEVYKRISFEVENGFKNMR